MAETRFYRIDNAGNLVSFPDLQSAQAGKGGYLWIDMASPDRETLQPLARALGVHPLSAKDCLDKAKVPKMDAFPDTTFLLFNSVRHDGGRLGFGEIDLILGRGFLLTVSGFTGEDQRFRERLAVKLKTNAEELAKGPDMLLHMLLDHVVDQKAGPVESIEAEMESAEEEILKNPATFKLGRLVALRRQLLQLRRSLFYERETLVKLCRRDSPLVGEHAVYHFRDIYDHITRYFEEAELLREMLLSLMEMHLTLMNNRMSATANRTNDTVRRLTFITTIFMPLTLLAGVGGMSEWTMMTGAQNWKAAYPVFMGLMVVIGTATYFALRWIEGRSKGPKA
ncbi:MAG: magnesium transporter CorA family protein [Elusimicrobiota bacterium]